MIKIVLVITTILLGFSIYSGYYPIAMVNFSPIMNNDFQTMHQATVQFYTGTIDRFQKRELNAEDAQKLGEESGRAVLDRLVEMEIIQREITNRMGDSLENEVNKRLANIDERTVTTGINALYGLTFEQFKKFIAQPEIEKELLTESLKKDAIDMKEWLKNERGLAEMMIFIPTLKWENKTVQLIK